MPARALARWVASFTDIGKPKLSHVEPGTPYNDALEWHGYFEDVPFTVPMDFAKDYTAFITKLKAEMYDVLAIQLLGPVQKGQMQKAREITSVKELREVWGRIESGRSEPMKTSCDGLRTRVVVKRRAPREMKQPELHLEALKTKLKLHGPRDRAEIIRDAMYARDSYTASMNQCAGAAIEFEAQGAHCEASIERESARWYFASRTMLDDLIRDLHPNRALGRRAPYEQEAAEMASAVVSYPVQGMVETVQERVAEHDLNVMHIARHRVSRIHVGGTGRDLVPDDLVEVRGMEREEFEKWRWLVCPTTRDREEAKYLTSRASAIEQQRFVVPLTGCRKRHVARSARASTAPGTFRR